MNKNDRFALPFSALIFLLYFLSDLSSGSESHGTGFFISSDGYLITNHHVVKNAGQVQILVKGKWTTSEIIKIDPANDLAVLKAPGLNYPTISLDFSPDLRPGERAFTVGFPDPSLLGFSPKTTAGEISAMAGLKDDIRFYQTNVAIQPGNSGGPLCDGRGNVIGVTTASVNALNRMQQAGYVPQNINFALKSSYIRPLLEPVPGLLASLPQKSGAAAEFREVQSRVENAVVSVKAISKESIGEVPPAPQPQPGPTPKPPSPPSNPSQYMIVSYTKNDGVNIRDSRDVNSKRNLHGALFQQTVYPLIKVGDSIWEGDKEWVLLKVKGWVCVKNRSSEFLSPEGGGSWKVNKNKDNFLAMRTGTSTDKPLVCKLAFATVIREVDRDFSDSHYHYILAEFAGWAVKRTRTQEYLRNYVP